MRIRGNFRHTVYACYMGLVTQAVCINFTALLFLSFQKEFALSLEQLSSLVIVNFVVQLAVDILCAKYILRIGYRKAAMLAGLFCAVGCVGLAVLPGVFSSPYAALLTAVSLLAVGCGMLEIVVTPLVQACPSDNKQAAMGLLHSFYCWGHAFVVLFSTAFFALFGVESWRVLACIWAFVPLLNAAYFSLVPIAALEGDKSGPSLAAMLKSKTLWLFILMMFCCGACEQSMAQWASYFAEAGLRVSKSVGDLLGPCLFALLMGTSRATLSKSGGRLKLKNALLLSAALCGVCFLVAALSQNALVSLLACALCGLCVGMMWPGTVSMTALRLPMGGTAMYALLSLGGDIGCGAGPVLVGAMAQSASGDLRAGFLFALIFPVLLCAGLLLNRKSEKSDASLLR